MINNSKASKWGHTVRRSPSPTGWASRRAATKTLRRGLDVFASASQKPKRR